MVKTWVVVHLIECGRNIAIPMKFVYTINRYHAYNRRINRNQVYLVFFSPNNVEPNFHLPIKKTFSETTDGCYHAKLLRCFGKYEIISK